MTAYDPCAHCEEMMQPYMDRVITDSERVEAEAHLNGCAYCSKRYRFEQRLRQFVRQAVQQEAMPVDLKLKLAGLRTPLQ
jgi:anti-sigma factor (TIGR02949 family)